MKGDLQPDNMTREVQPGLISVVMPCYNAVPFVEEAVASVLSQTYRQVELIAIDDGSDDGSPAVLERLRSAEPARLTVLQTQREGPYPARNRGLAVAHGEYIAFLDADDYWERDCLAQLQATLHTTAADVAYCGWQNHGPGAPSERPYIPPAHELEDTALAFLRACPWPIHAALLRRSMVERLHGFSVRKFTSMDYDLWIRLLGEDAKIARVPRVLAHYRWHDRGQISKVKWRQVLDAWEVRRDFVQANPSLVRHIDPDTLREVVNGALLTSGMDAYWKRDLESAQILLRAAMRERTVTWRDLKYALPTLLPGSAFRALVSMHDRRERGATP